MSLPEIFDGLKYHFHAERLVVYHEDILVQPTQVDVLLSGAIVGLESTMHHWRIQGYEAYDSFQAMLQKITVLRQMLNPENLLDRPQAKEVCHNTCAISSEA